MIYEELALAYECISSLGNSLDMKTMSKEFMRTLTKKSDAICCSLYIKDYEHHKLNLISHVGKKKYILTCLNCDDSFDFTKEHYDIEIDSNMEFCRLYLVFQRSVFVIVYSLDNPNIKRYADIFFSFKDKINSTIDASLLYIQSQEKLNITSDTLSQKELELESINKNLQQIVKDEIAKNKQKDELLAHQSRLAAMGEMMGNIAHQWRQPLASLSMILQSYKHAFRANRLDEEFIDKQTIQAKELADHMSQTIDDFRNFFKPNKNKEKFDPIKSITKVLAILEATLKNKDIKIQLNYAENIPHIYGFENEFSQAIINILNNAKDELIKKDSNKLITIDLKTIENDIIISILDNAGGIPEEILPKIFEPYFTTKHQASGTGIGLYMTKQIIESHMDGKIIAYNNPNGATFEIILKIEDNENI
jgi:signal transduction histidine kinase